ncbi:hypothetical protein AAFA46_05815 [Oscillospiraceae bacterium WX1]
MGAFKSKWSKTPKPVQITLYIILGLLGVTAMGILFGYIIQLLWNWLMPELFGLGTISYWQAIGIFILAKLLFGFGMGGNGDKASKSNKRREQQHDAACGNWADYDAWWEKEGKSAFQKYATEKSETENDL